MKKLTLLSIMLSGSFLHSQILNPSFESVTANKPDNWNTAANFYNTYYIRDTSDAKAGLRGAYIKGFSAQSYSVQGAALGTFTMNTRPIALTGWYKSNIVAGDSLVFYVNLYQSSVYSGSVANGFANTLSSTQTYKQFTATINYASFPPGNAGSTYIGIYFSGSNVDAQGYTIPQTGTWAIIDDLAFTYPPPPTNTFVAIPEINGKVDVEMIYPQPATDVICFIYSLHETATVDLQLIDITGKSVKTTINNEKQSGGRYKSTIDLSDLAPGVYFAKLKAGNETKVSKIIKQ